MSRRSQRIATKNQGLDVRNYKVMGTSGRKDLDYKIANTLGIPSKRTKRRNRILSRIKSRIASAIASRKSSKANSIAPSIAPSIAEDIPISMSSGRFMGSQRYRKIRSDYMDTGEYRTRRSVWKKIKKIPKMFLLTRHPLKRTIASTYSKIKTKLLNKVSGA